MKSSAPVNHFHLKVITLAAMVIDHLAWAFIDSYSMTGELMHMIGRMVAPMMAYFLVIGVRHSQDKVAYVRRLFGFALISQPVFMWFQYQIGMVNALGDVLWGNVLFTLGMALLGLMAVRTRWPTWVKTLAIVGLAAAAQFGEYGMAMLLWALIFDYFWQHKTRMLVTYVLSLPLAYLLIYGANATVGLGFMHAGWLIAVPLIAMYSGKKGRALGGRYFFYAFYPLHLAVIAAMVWAYDRMWEF